MNSKNMNREDVRTVCMLVGHVDIVDRTWVLAHLIVDTSTREKSIYRTVAHIAIYVDFAL